MYPTSQIDQNQQRVFIVGEGLLFDDGLEHLLKLHRPNLIVSHLIYSGDLKFLESFASPPDVILIVESADMDAVHILDLLSSWPIVKKLRIIVIRARNNVIDIYEEVKRNAGKITCSLRKITDGNLNDLFGAMSIENDLGRNRAGGSFSGVS